MNINREALVQCDRVLLTAIEAVGFEIAEKVQPRIPDAYKGYMYPSEGVRIKRELGEGLVDRGVGYLSYVDGKKVGGDSRVDKKPKAFKVRGKGVSVAVGMGFPMRFYEMGTVHQPARPTFAPVVSEVVGSDVLEEAAYRAFRSYLGTKAGKLQRKYNLGPSTLLRRI